MLAIMLLPVGQLAGIPLQQASAQDGGMLMLSQWGFNTDNDGAWFDLDVLYDEGEYDLLLRLYRQTTAGIYEPVQEGQGSISLNSQGGSQAHAEVRLPPGTYKIEFELAVEEEGVLDQVEFTFTLSGSYLSVFLFGADENTQVELYDVWGEYVVPLRAYEAGNGYVLYTYEVYNNGYYLFRSADHPTFEEKSIDPVSQKEYVYHLEQPQYEVILLDRDITVEDGFLSVYLDFYGWEDLYRLVFTDQNGNVIEACVEEIENEFRSETGTRVDIQCELPSGAKSLRLDAVVDGFVFPTNLVLHVNPIRPPGQILMEDWNPDIDEIDLRVQFEDSPDASEIALYMVYAGGSESVMYRPAGGGQYNLQVDALYTFPGDRFTIRMIGNDGHEYIAYTEQPLIDDISGMTGNIEFACEDDGGVGVLSSQSDPSRYYCENFDRFEEEDFVPQDAKNHNGTIGWTLPDTGDFELTAYDLYYANEDMEIIKGAVRINSPELYATGAVAYSLFDAPEDAAYVAVVTLLHGWEEEEEEGYGDFVYYYMPPFFIPIGQPSGEQEPEELVEESEFMLLDDGSYGYIPKGMTVGLLLDKFRFASDAEAVILNSNDELGNFDPVAPGSILVVTLGERREEFALRFLSELLRPSGTEPIMIAHIAAFVVAQLTAGDPADVTGDGRFDRDDVRLLLGETEYWDDGNPSPSGGGFFVACDISDDSPEMIYFLYGKTGNEMLRLVSNHGGVSSDVGFCSIEAMEMRESQCRVNVSGEGR